MSARPRLGLREPEGPDGPDADPGLECSELRPPCAEWSDVEVEPEPDPDLFGRMTMVVDFFSGDWKLRVAEPERETRDADRADGLVESEAVVGAGETCSFVVFR
jgi:hypothetical protein